MNLTSFGGERGQDFFSFVAMTLNFRIFLRTKCTWLETEMEKARFLCTNDTCSLFH